MNLNEKRPIKSEELSDKNQRSIIRLLIKIVGSVLAIYLLISKIDLQASVNHILEINPLYIICGLILFNLSQIASAFRLNLFFEQIGIRIKNLFNIRLYYVGMFYNMLLPGGIGGDGFKAYLLNKYTQVSLKPIIKAVLADRLIGLFAIGILISTFSFFIKSYIPLDFHWTIYLLPILVLIGLFMYSVLFPQFKNIIIKTTLFSLLNQAFQLGTILIILAGLGIQENISGYLVVFLISSIATAIPISIGGLGLREVVFLFASGYLGLNQEITVAVPMLFFLITLVSSIPGLYFHYTLKSEHWDSQLFSTKS